MEYEAKQDNDFQDFEPKYTKRIQEIKQNITKSIRNPLAKETFNKDFELKSTYSFYDIMNDGRRRFLEYDKDLMAQEKIEAQERYYSASTTAEKEDARNEIAAIYSRRVENKTLNKAEAAVLYKKAVKELTEGQANYDIYTNPNYALEELQKGEKGAYRDLLLPKRAELTGKAKTRLKKLKEETDYFENQAKINTRFEIINKISNGEINWKEADDYINLIGSNDPKLAEAISKGLEKTYMIEKEDNKPFGELAINILTSKNEKIISDFLVNALANPNISRDRLGMLVFAAKKRSNEIKKGAGFWANAARFMVEITNPFILYNALKRTSEENADDKRAEEIMIEEIYNQADTDKTLPAYSEENITYTMQKHNLTREEVLKRLGVTE